MLLSGDVSLQDLNDKPSTAITPSKVRSHCNGNGNDFVAHLFIQSGFSMATETIPSRMGSVQTNRGIHMMINGNSNDNRKVASVCICSVAIAFGVAITKWAHNPFNNNAATIAVVVSHHVNTSICLHRTHS